MNKLVKLKQIASVSDKTETSYKLTFPVKSNGPQLFLEFLEIRKSYFKKHPAFTVEIENIKVIRTDIQNVEVPVFSIRMNWIREIAQDCYQHIKSNLWKQ